MCFWIYIKVTFEWHVKCTIFENIHLWSNFQQVFLAPPQIWYVAKFKALSCSSFFVLIVFWVEFGISCKWVKKNVKNFNFSHSVKITGRLMEKRTALGKETNNTFLILNCVNRDKKGNVSCTKRVVGLGHEQTIWT